MNRITKKQEAAYLKSKGTWCPKCKSDQLEGAGVDVDASEATQEMACNDCGATWTDVYKLVGVLQ